MNTDRRKLKTPHYLIVDSITFSPPVRSSAAWAEGDNVVFKGTLEQILIFALQNFSLSGVAVAERYTVVSERDFANMAPTDDVTILDMDPTVGLDLIIQEEVDIIKAITGDYRKDWSENTGLITELVADATEKSYWAGSRLVCLAYLMQYNVAGTNYIYNLNKWAFFDKARARNFGSEIFDLLGTQGPVDVEPAHDRLGQSILSI